MGTVEERVAYLEGQTGEQTSVLSELRLNVRDVRGEMHDLRGEMQDLRGEMRDIRGEMNRRFDKVDERFGWLIGFQFATFMAIIAALLNVYFR